MQVRYQAAPRPDRTRIIAEIGPFGVGGYPWAGRVSAAGRRLDVSAAKS